MYYSSGLEYIVSNFYSRNYSSSPTYCLRFVDDKYEFSRNNHSESAYIGNTTANSFSVYKAGEIYPSAYTTNHSFSPTIFLSPLRPKSRIIVDNNEVRNIVKEIFELMMKEKMPDHISINVLSLNDFKALHSQFGSWSNGILGFSINGDKKLVFVRENNLDELMIVIGHEIGHVLTDTLPNKHDEEAKAFAFSIEWARTIKKHNVAGLGLSIKEETEFDPARNGLHDIAFHFVDFMIKKGRKAIELHRDLVSGYISFFDRIY